VNWNGLELPDNPYYQDEWVTIHNQDFRTNDLPDESVQCVVTSPPYWGLRKYSGEQDLIWGDNDCEHEWGNELWATSGRNDSGETRPNFHGQAAGYGGERKVSQGNFCSLCGAWKGAYGLELTPEMYVQHTIEILREIRRVLRKDGVVFWNIGDSYWGGKGQSGQPMSAATQQERCDRGESINQSQHQMEMATRPQDGKHSILKPKDLCLIPFRVAIAAQEDGWWVRSIIIWSKPNPMPESVTDRPTESHEYILMLTKSKKYYWDADAVREPHLPVSIARTKYGWHGNLCEGHSMGGIKDVDKMETCHPNGRNIRTVWEFPTQPYPEAHFAVFPEKLPEICIKAATPEVGCCSKCGAPWERVVEKTKIPVGNTRTRYDLKDNGGRLALHRQGVRGEGHEDYIPPKTLGWQPTCKCNADKVPSLVLDPFMGSGTVLWVSKKLNRKAVGFDTSEEYCQLSLERNRQQVMELKI